MLLPSQASNPSSEPACPTLQQHVVLHNCWWLQRAAIELSAALISMHSLLRNSRNNLGCVEGVCVIMTMRLGMLCSFLQLLYLEHLGREQHCESQALQIVSYTYS
jgi:hypothetical protein